MNLTINKFQNLQAIADLDDNEIEKASRLVQVLLDKSSDEVDKMSIKKFGRLCKKLNDAFDLTIKKPSNSTPSKYIYANKKYYRLNFDIKPPFNTGRYIEVLTFSKMDVISNMHNILASMCQPIRWSWSKFRFIDLPYNALDHEGYADDMKEAGFKLGYSAVVFFLSNISEFNEKYIGLFSNKKDETDQKKHFTIEENFTENFGWIYNAKQVSEFEGIPLDSVYELSVIHFLNDLLYLKNKKEIDEHQHKQSANGFS